MKEKLEDIVEMMSTKPILGNGRKEDGLGAVYNGLVKVLFLT